MRVGKANGNDWLRLGEAASALGVSLNTVRRWSDSGRLTCYRSPGGHRRYRISDVESLLRRQDESDADTGRPAPIHQTATLRRASMRTPLEALAQVAAEGIGVPACRILLRDSQGALRIAAAYDRATLSSAENSNHLVAPDEEPVAADVLRTGRRMVIADLTATNLLVRGEAEAYMRRGLAAILGLPIAAKGRVIAAMELGCERGPRPFSGADVAFAEFVARQVASLMVNENVEPAQDHQAQNSPTALGEETPILGAAGSLDTGSLLRALTRHLRIELDAVACDILRFDAEERSLTLVAADADGEAAPLEGLLYSLDDLPECGSVLTTARAVTIRGLQGDSLAGTHLVRFEGSGARSVHCTPLRLGDETVGLLEIFSTDPLWELGREALAIAEAGAATAALALAGDDNSAALAHRLSRLDDFITGFADNESVTDVDSLVRAGLNIVLERAEVGSCALYRIEEEEAVLVVAAAPEERRRRTLPAWRLADYPVAAEAVTRGAPVAAAADSAWFSPEAAAAFCEARGLAGVIVAPLIFHERLMGLFELGLGVADDLDGSVPLTRIVTDFLAMAMGSGDIIARLKRRNRDLALLLEAGLEDTSRLSTDDVLHGLLERLSQLTHTPVTDVYAVEGDTLRALVSYDGGSFDAEWEGVVIPLSRYPCSRHAVETGEIVVVPDLDDSQLTTEGRYSLEKWGYQSQLTMPLVSSGRVIGLVELSDYVPRDFAADVELIRGLGQVATHALLNAALFEQAEQRSHVLNELVELGALATRTHDFDEAMKSIAQRILGAVDAANCDIFRVEGAALRCVASFDRSGYDADSVGTILDPQRYPTVVRAMSERQMLIISNPDDPQLSEAERRTYRDYGFSSEVCVPLIVGEELCGLIDLYDTRERDYAEYLSFLKSAGQTLAGALQNALLLEQGERRSHVLREIVGLGALVAQTHDLEHLLGVLAERLRTTIDAADCDIFTLQGDDLRCLVSADANGLDQSVVGSVLNMDRFPATAMAVRTGSVMAVAGLDDPRLTDAERDDMGEYGYQSELCIPLVVGDRAIGLIDVFDTRPRSYDEHLDYMRSVGQTAAGAIENALLVTELERRNTALAELVELGKVVAGSGGLDQLVRTVGPHVVEVMEADGCQVFAVHDDHLHCLLTYENGEYQDDYAEQPLDLAAFPSTRVALEKLETLIIENPDDARLSDYERDLYRSSGSQSEICVPLAVEGRVLGLLDVYDHRSRDYTDHVDFLQSVGQLVAGAFENAALVERLERNNQTLSLLVDSGLEFSSTLEADEVLQSVARRLCAATAAADCDIFTLHDDTLRCVACIDRGEPDPDYVGTEYSISDLPLITAALETRRPVAVSDIASDPRLTDRERREDMGWGHRSMLQVPLISRGDVIGLAGIYDDHPREFDQLDLIHSLAQGAANALANATLFEQLDRGADRLALLSDVSYELSASLDLQEVLQSAARRLCDISGMPTCDIYALRDNDELESVVCIADGEVDTSWQGRRFPLSGWAAVEKAVQDREPVVVETRDDPLLLSEERACMESFGETGALIVPLISKYQVIGVLELSHRGDLRTFSPEEMDTIVSICRVSALAIDNANLVANLRVRGHENELLNDIARATGASLNLADIAAGALDKLRELVAFDTALLALRDDCGGVEVAYSSGPERAQSGAGPTPLLDSLLPALDAEHVLILRLPDDLPDTVPGADCEDMASLALIGIMKGETLIGSLELASREDGAFDSLDRRLMERTGTHLALAIGNARLYEDIKRMHLSNLKALSSALNAKDYYTLGHAARVATYMVLLGEELGWPTEMLRHVEEAAYLHDIGKIGVSDRVLLKPSGLNDREWDLMRQHPMFSADIIRPLFDEALVQGVRHHHERWEGGGYPDGLRGEEIPEIARAMCVADSYDAMSFRRPYRHAFTADECIGEMERCSGTQFDPSMVAAFKRVLASLALTGRLAAEAAADAAASIDPEAHVLLRTRDDESRREYAQTASALRDVCAAHPPTRRITTHARVGKKIMTIVDSDAGTSDKPHIGQETVASDQIAAAFAGATFEANVLSVDQWGVWVTGVAPVRDADGHTVAVVLAAIPTATGITEMEGLGSNVAQTFTAMLHSAATQIGRAEVEAITDGLTGLYNHRYFHERLSEEIERSQEQGTTLSLLFCDIDDFHAYNDLHGHGAGDRALRAVARVIEGSVRHIDLAARYGGEEFAAILVDTGEDGALEVAERIRNGVALTPLSAGGDTVSVSLGVATVPADATFKEELIDKADWALYLAKRRGGDRAMTFSAEHGSQTPEQAAAVGPGYTHVMAELVAARGAYIQRRRAAITHLSRAIGRELGLDSDDVRAAIGSASGGSACDPHDSAHRVVAVATAYEEMVVERAYRPQISEAEALEELLGCPALRDDPGIASALRNVLARD